VDWLPTVKTSISNDILVRDKAFLKLKFSFWTFNERGKMCLGYFILTRYALASRSEQTTSHIVSDCLQTKLDHGLH